MQLPFEKNGHAYFNSAFTTEGRNEKIFSFHLKKMGINRILDIGGNNGQFVHRIRQLGFDGYVYSVEPLIKAHRHLVNNAIKDPKWTALIRQGAGKEKDIIEINVSQNSHSSSFLKVHKNHTNAEPTTKTVKTELVQVNPTSKIAQRDVLEHIDAIKIDVQGFEKQVIEGYLDLMPKIRLMLVELSIVECYEGAPSLFELDHYIINELGFKRVSLEPTYYDDTTGTVQQYDGIYYKPDSKAVPSPEKRKLGIFTSIGGNQTRKCTKGTEIGGLWRRHCLGSWKNISNSIYSVSEEQPFKDTITWLKTDSKPSINEILYGALETDENQFLLTNADIYLTEDCKNLLPHLDQKTVYFSIRANVEVIKKENGAFSTPFLSDWYQGFDVFIINREFAKFVLDNKLWSDGFRIGEPFWDYLLPVTAMAFGFPTKRLAPRPILAMHATHEEKWQTEFWGKNATLYANTLREIEKNEMCIANLHLQEILKGFPANEKDATEQRIFNLNMNTLSFLYSRNVRK